MNAKTKATTETQFLHTNASPSCDNAAPKSATPAADPLDAVIAEGSHLSPSGHDAAIPSRPYTAGDCLAASSLPETNELSTADPANLLRCADARCGAPATDGTVRTISGERWFTCTRGHLNAEMLDPFAEAA